MLQNSLETEDICLQNRDLVVRQLNINCKDDSRIWLLQNSLRECLNTRKVEEQHVELLCTKSAINQLLCQSLCATVSLEWRQYPHYW